MRASTIRLFLGLGLAAAAPGCYSAAFTPTAQYSVAPRAGDAVQIMTARPDPTQFREVGIVTAQGAGFEGALKRAKELAAQHGCEVLVVVSEAVETGRGVPGSAYGMTRNDLRCSCMVRSTHAAAE